MTQTKLKISPAAKRFFKNMKKQKHLQSIFQDALSDIIANPLEAGNLKTGDLAGIYGYDIYYNGVNYEIAYAIEKGREGKTILIILAGTRENFYQELKRYWM
mgnify:CR=1 FL=1